MIEMKKEEETATKDKDGFLRTKYGTIFNDLEGKKVEIRDVWAENLEAEMKALRDCIEKYPYIAMDTEFPGVVARPIGSFANSIDYHYQTLRCNCDLLKIIQLGLACYDKDGKRAVGYPIWQFNFKFSLTEDIYAKDSIELLQRSGIDFKQHEERGIDIAKFGELLIPSGLVLTDDVYWISFHSGYDFGYLLKLATCLPLPKDENAFFENLSTYFPHVYDIKHLVRDIDSLRGGLASVAIQLGVRRIGPVHQAGSDALITADTFFALRQQHFEGKAFGNRHSGILYGLKNSHHAS
eukprot:g2104.t1